MPFFKEFSLYRAMDFFPFRWWHIVMYLALLAFIYYWQPHEITVFITTLLFIGSTFYDIIGYMVFRGWHKKLPFTVEGWEELVTTKNFNDSWYWTDVEIILHFSEKIDFSKDGIDSLWNFFIGKTDKHFYPPELSSTFLHDPRHRWKAKDNRAMGSMNSRMAKELYLFLTKKLASLAKSGIALTKVSLHLKK